MSPRRALVLRAGGLALLVAAAVAVRAADLARPLLSIDEAESAINALTILEHGVPTDRYVGVPLYENTLLRPWPESEEYAFRDLSYSSRGLAVYHGWLPLYAIALSYRLAGVSPDAPPADLHVQHGPADEPRRTWAARLPAVVFAALFVLVAWWGGRCLYGEDAAWIAAAGAAFAEPCVRVGREARYYSATLLFSTLACVLLWRLARPRQADRGAGSAVAVGAALVLLFHTHVLAFATAAVGAALLAPRLLRTPRPGRDLGLVAAIVAAGTLPWVLLTGFLEAVGAAPAARELLRFPQDYAAYLAAHGDASLLMALGALWLGVVRFAPSRLPERLVAPSRRGLAPAGYLLGWIGAGYLLFLLLVPAASCFLWRATLPIQGPGLLLGGLLAAAGLRALGAGPRALAAAVVVLSAGLLATHDAPRRLLAAPPRGRGPLQQALDYLRATELPPDARLYATPTQHLPLMLYSGLPVQSVAPIRREFLERYPGEVVVLETVRRPAGVPSSRLAEAAAEGGVDLGAGELSAWTERLATRVLREALATRGVDVVPPVDRTVPTWVAAAIAEQRAALRREPPRADPSGLWQNPAVFRGHEAYDQHQFWQVFFYRFVDPAARSGSRLNYATRIAGARAVVLPCGWVVYRSPGRAP